LASPEYMSVVGPGMCPLPLHSSVLAHIVHAQVPLALLMIMICVLLRIWALRVSICTWGWISCHSGSAHGSGGVSKHWWREDSMGWEG